MCSSCLVSVVAAGRCRGPLQSSTVPLSFAGLEPTCPGTQERVRELNQSLSYITALLWVRVLGVRGAGYNNF